MDGRDARSYLGSMLLDKDKKPEVLPLSLLRNITENFAPARLIGGGGFSFVYKGLLENGLVAVKRLSNSYKYEKEFQREIQCLIKVKHKNIVRFFGYCHDTQGRTSEIDGEFIMADVQERLLCFEYVRNGNLQKYITDASRGLEWTSRYTIIKEICDGLYYLHCNNIVHLDLKPANILMDDDMTPKIADFGLSRCFKEGQSQATASKVAGTFGYLAPEFNQLRITRKYDFYSLGVIITQILTGSHGYHGVEEVLEKWIGRLLISQRQQVQVWAEIAIQCTKFNPSERLTSMLHLLNRLNATESPDLQNQQIISVKNTNGIICCLDAQPTQPWIITGHQHGDVCAWNYVEQGNVESFQVMKESIMPSCVFSNKVHAVKVIPKKKWFLAATSDGVIHVYNYDTKENSENYDTEENSKNYDTKVQKMKSFRAACDCYITSMAVHPTCSYVLSSAHREIKLWYWNNGWECTQSFAQEHSGTIVHVSFNPKDTKLFASASEDRTVKVWSIDSSKSMYTLSGHSDKVNCLDLFTRDDRHYLISGSGDCTAKVWDMMEKTCIHTMEVFVSPVISVIAFADRQYLITGSKDGYVHLWSSSDFRLERIVNFGSGGAIVGLGRLMGPRRIVIGQEYAVSIMDLDKEEPIATEGSNESSL